LLKIPDKAWYVIRVLVKMRLEHKKKDTITYREIAKILGFYVTRSKTNKAKHRIALVINKLIELGVLTRGEEKGTYIINYVAVEHYANVTLPMGTKLEYLPRGPNYEYWPEAIEAVEVAKEFNSLVAWTRVMGPFYSDVEGLEPPAGNALYTPPAKRSKRTGTAVRTLKPPKLKHLTLVTVLVGPHRLSVLKRGIVYVLLMGVHGAAQTTFPCIKCRTPAGGTRYLCAGSEKVLQELLATVGPNPICTVAGGELAPTSVVADVPGQGLQPLEYVSATVHRLEPGIQVYNTALLAIAPRYNFYVGYSRALGLPAVVAVPRHVVYSQAVTNPLRLQSDAYHILDALEGTVYATLDQLPALDTPALRGQPRALLQAPPPPTPPAGGTTTVYVDYVLTVNGQRTKRNVTELRNFIANIRQYAREGKKVSVYSLRLIIPLVGADSTGLADTLNFGFLYIYHNSRKDPPGAVRIELRPYAGVLQVLGVEATLAQLVRTLKELLPALEATHRALVPWVVVS